MLKKPHYMALGLVALLTLVVLNLPPHTAGRVKLAIGSLFLPLFGLSRTSHQVTRQAASSLTPRSELNRQIDELKRTNQVLQIQAMRYEQLVRDDEAMRRFIYRTNYLAWKLKFAHVVTRDTANWWRTVMIDLGSRDGMQVDHAVLTADGLVGRISLVFPTTSQVELIGNPTCKVAARVRQTGEGGVIAGSSGQFDRSLVALSYLSSNSNLKPGQTVETSGDGGLFPAGIVIGQVAEEAQPVEFGLRAEAQVKLSANLGALDDVWVIAQ